MLVCAYSANNITRYLYINKYIHILCIFIICTKTLPKKKKMQSIKIIFQNMIVGVKLK